jgi:hypothetical protein
MSSSSTRTWLGKSSFSVFEKDKCREILVVLTTGVVDTGGKKFAATINDSNGQLDVGVIDTGGAP